MRRKTAEPPSLRSALLSFKNRYGHFPRCRHRNWVDGYDGIDGHPPCGPDCDGFGAPCSPKCAQARLALQLDEAVS